MESNNRWWDYYYVRYFVGAIAGSVLFFGALISNDPLWHQVQTWFPATEEGVTTVKILNGSATAAIETLVALGTAGLAYCYLASAPVLLLHALRERLGGKSAPLMYTKVVISAITVGALLFLSLILFSCKATITPAWCRFLPYALIVVIQMVLVLSANPERIRAHYDELSRKRARAFTKLREVHESATNKEIKSERTIVSAESELIQSYRHLREHGNAFLIVSLEAVLAYALSGAPSFYAFGLMIFAWILPATFTWFLGTYLELKFRDGI
jgi:hypothetical protein